MPYTDCISIATEAGHFFFSPQEIVRLEARSSYTNIFFTNKKNMIASKVLKDFAAMLEPMGFVRTHRSHLVNSQYVAFVSNTGNIVMKDESIAEVSRRQKTSVMKKLRPAA